MALWGMASLVTAKSRSYQAVLSIGPQCLTSNLLKRARLKAFSGPFDWIFSSLSMVADCIETNFADLLNVDFIKPVPTAWDETRFLDGTPETCVALARRKGKVWYIGAMTNDEGRRLALPLGFLGKGAYSAKLWQDGADANAVATTTQSVTANDSLTLNLKPAGGAVVVLTPQ